MLAKRSVDRALTMSESLASSLRTLPDDFVSPTSDASPALALQSHLERAVLASFQHAPAQAVAGPNGAVMTIVAAAVVGWAAAIGTALFLFA